ncbi:hypothetical protein AB1Y20_022262 [Prymnesium parvum]|uniref:Uncharacterized protein n=1 Tax=Prymnesium parvum TaxID=97485 RepID=A0AB34JIB3_PRYPA
MRPLRERARLARVRSNAMERQRPPPRRRSLLVTAVLQRHQTSSSRPRAAPPRPSDAPWPRMLVDCADFFLTICGLVLCACACCGVPLVPELAELVNFAEVTADVGASEAHPLLAFAPAAAEAASAAFFSSERIRIFFLVSGVCVRYELSGGASPSTSSCFAFAGPVLRQDEGTICADTGAIERANISSTCTPLADDEYLRYACALHAMGRTLQLPARLRDCAICTEFERSATAAKAAAAGVLRSLCANNGDAPRSLALLLAALASALLKFLCFCSCPHRCDSARLTPASTLLAALAAAGTAFVGARYYSSDYPAALGALVDDVWRDHGMPSPLAVALGPAFYCCAGASLAFALAFVLVVCAGIRAWRRRGMLDERECALHNPLVPTRHRSALLE